MGGGRAEEVMKREGDGERMVEIKSKVQAGSDVFHVEGGEEKRYEVFSVAAVVVSTVE